MKLTHRRSVLRREPKGLTDGRPLWCVDGRWLQTFALVVVLGVLSCSAFSKSPGPTSTAEPTDSSNGESGIEPEAKGAAEGTARLPASRVMDVRRTRVGSSDGAAPDAEPRAGGDVEAERPPDPPAAALDRGGPSVGPPVRGLHSVPSTILVGLASDHESVAVSCCAGEARLFNALAEFRLTGPVTVRSWTETENGVAAPSSFFVQVAALKDSEQASALAQRLATSLGLPANAVFDARTDLYKVRMGPVASRQAADQLEPRILSLGYRNSWVVREENGASRSGFEVSAEVPGGRPLEVRFIGRHLLLETAQSTVSFAGESYRGRLLLFLNDRGKINVVNEIALEDYLRGVVPKELGPDLYPELEALKAQAVAARTYTVRNLGEFLAEGYDICSTPRCQVYGGLGVEHPLSDRAIRETTGMILVAAAPSLSSVGSSAPIGRDDFSPAGSVEIIDAMFSASCGGHTENVETVFPSKRADYLRARPCIEAGASTVVAGDSGSIAARLASRLPDAGSSASSATGSVLSTFEQQLLGLAQAARVAVPRDRLHSLNASEVSRFLTSTFDLRLDRRLLDSQVGSPSSSLPLASLPMSQRRLGAALSALGSRSRRAEITDADRISIVIGLAEALSLVRIDTVGFGSAGDGTIEVFESQRSKELRFSTNVALLTGDVVGTLRPMTSLQLFAGDSVELIRWDGEVLGMILPARPAGSRVPNPAPPWSRFRSRARLQQLVAERYPGFRLAQLEIGEVGESGRLKSLIMVDGDGQRQVATGLAIRWILDLPDTWFRMSPERRGGVDGWVFRGHGRGHGVGLCQVGAYGMAMLGHRYQEILEHYYAGATLMQASVDRPKLPWQQPRAD